MSSGVSYGSTVKYNPDIDIQECSEVYPPSDDTFLLLDCVEVTDAQAVLEMGCGTGLISVHCADAGALVTAVDINPKAVECTRRNALRNGIWVDAFLSDLFSQVSGRFDLIIFNPPYLAVQEDGLIERSWSGGEGGTNVLEEFLASANHYLSKNGTILVLLSSEMEKESVDRVLTSFRIKEVGKKKLFFEELRVVCLTLDED